MATAAVPHDPRFYDATTERMTLPCFYLGTHRPNWLWDGQAGYPLMISYRTLRTVARPRPAVVPGWALDSGGFMELSKHGRWTVSPREYAEAVARYDREVGGLEWAACQDWMCEPAVIHGGRVGLEVFPGTGLSVAEHQRRSLGSFRELTALWPDYSDTECPFMPPLQGYEPDEYERHANMYAAEGIDLGVYPLVTIGSVCRRSSTAAITDVAKVVGSMNISAHWFGVKLDGIRIAGLRQGEAAAPASLGLLPGDMVPAGTASLDSASWSYDARRSPRLPGCAHVSPKTGDPSKCNNCPAFAAQWRERVLKALRAAHFAGVCDPLFARDVNSM